MAGQLTAVSLLIVGLSGLVPFATSENYIRNLDTKQFQGLRDEPGIKVVYFQPQRHETKGEEVQKMQNIQHFLKQYEKSASVIRVYEVDLCILDCARQSAPKYCNSQESRSQVYIFRDGIELLTLGLENMFDVNSIVSNVLQIVLLRDVPILQDKSERLEYQNGFMGKRDVMFSFQKAVGTYEHRVLMEVAYAFNEKFQFALTTELDVVKDLPDFDASDESAIWHLSCKSNKCKAMKYKKKMALADVVRYMKSVGANIQNQFMPKTFKDFELYEEYGLHSAYAYYGMEEKKMVIEETEILSQRFDGMVGFYLINMNDQLPTVPAVEAARGSQLPALAFKPYGKSEVIMMNVDQDPADFLAEQLQRVESGDFTDGSSYLDEEQVLLSEVEKEDDDIAKAVSKLKQTKLPRGNLPELCDKGFPKFIADAEFAMVIFFVPFDVRGVNFLYQFANASESLAADGISGLASVDCFDWTDVCTENSVTSYPTVRIYRRGKDYREYKGFLTQSAVIAAVKMYLAGSPVALSSVDQAKQYLMGSYPAGLGKVSATSVLGLFGDHMAESSLFKSVAAQVEGKLVFGTVAGDAATAIAAEYGTSVPSIVVVKRNDAFQPSVSRALSSGMTPTNVLEWISHAYMPTFPELNPYNFPAYFAKKKPFVFLFTNDRQSMDIATLGKLSASGTVPEVHFAWMDISQPNSLGLRVLRQYVSNPGNMQIVLVNHKEGTIHNYKEAAVEGAPITSWVRSALAGQIKFCKRLPKGEWKPRNPGFDFLKMIDEDAERRSHMNSARKEVQESFMDVEEDQPVDFSKHEASENDVRMDLANFRLKKKPSAKHQHTEL